MLHDIILILWFFLPAGIANMAPIFAAKIPGLASFNQPIDGGRSLKGKRILGDHKTWRGLIIGIILGWGVFLIQQYVTLHTPLLQQAVDPISYAALPWFFGALFGIGALGGDAVKSFFKRRIDVPSGKSWMPFDQIDYILGTILVTFPFLPLGWSVYLLMLVLGFVLHVASTYIGWLLKFKDEPI